MKSFVYIVASLLSGIMCYNLLNKYLFHYYDNYIFQKTIFYFFIFNNYFIYSIYVYLDLLNNIYIYIYEY